jgi:hypothetical protein
MANATKFETDVAEPTKPLRESQLTNVWYVSAAAGVIAIVVGAGAFYAGRQSATLQLSNVTSRWKAAQQQADMAAFERDAARKDLDNIRRSIGPTDLNNVASTIQDRDRIRELSAEVNNYRNLLERNKLEKSTDLALAALVSSPNARILPFKLNESLPHAAVNLAFAEGGQAAFVAANLPKEHHYQLWLIKKGKDDITRGQSFTSSADRTILELGAGTLTGVVQIIVTEEALSISEKPARPPIMVLSLE